MHRKSVHIGAQTYRAISFALAFQHADHARSPNAAMDFDSPQLEEIRNYLPSTMFLETGFGVCMKFMSDSNNFGQKCPYLRRYIHFRAPQSKTSANILGIHVSVGGHAYPAAFFAAAVGRYQPSPLGCRVVGCSSIVKWNLSSFGMNKSDETSVGSRPVLSAANCPQRDLNSQTRGRIRAPMRQKSTRAETPAKSPSCWWGEIDSNQRCGHAYWPSAQ